MPRKWLVHNSILLILREIETNNSREKMEVYILSDTFHCICKFTYETKILEPCSYYTNKIGYHIFIWQEIYSLYNMFKYDIMYKLKIEDCSQHVCHVYHL